jgi:predicted nucleotidyltransferase component of viral defense system
MYFGDYRFSEDLDFSAVDAPRGEDMARAVGVAVGAAERLLLEEGRFRLEFDRPSESAPQVRVKLEITHDEPVLLPPVRLPIIHAYEALGHVLPPGELATYSLEEVVAEKLRALRQTQQQLERRGWNKPRARDYYDLWWLLRQKERPVDRAVVAGILGAKMAARGVGFAGTDDFFTPQLVTEAQRNWRANLGTFVRSLPDLDTVLAELRPLAATIVEAAGGRPA